MDYHEFFTYDQDTGSLVWRPRPRSHFKTDAAWRRMNSRFAGKAAGYVSKSGANTSYVYINLVRMRSAHLIIWEMHHGPIPPGMEIDHINGVGTDNRLFNLRLATKAQNGRNRSKNKNNTSGIKGVWMDKRDGVWQAEIMVGRKKITLGRYLTKGLAAVARAKASMRYHGEFARI